MSKSIYVLDTCVLLHDPHSIYKFEEHDVYIPLAVIDDLDDIKVKRESVGWAAREVFRQLEKFAINDLIQGVKVNDQKGKLFVYNTLELPKSGEVLTITKTNSDNALIEACIQLSKKFPKRKVCLVSKDTGLRVRAASYDVVADNYKNDMLDAELFNGYDVINIDDKTVFDSIFKSKEILESDLRQKIKDLPENIYPNQFLIIKNNDFSCIFIKKGDILKSCFDKTKPFSFMGISPRNLEQKLSTYLLNDEEIPLVSLSGKAGTGKSICALAVGLEKINNGTYDKLVVIKPLVPVGGKEIGFLPGDKFSKIAAWLGPIKDNLEQLIHSKENGKGAAPGCFEEMCEEGMIEVEALTFIQGRSIARSFIILDEAENVSPREARMLIERCSHGSKVVLLGDLSQIENPYLDQYSSGLTHTIQGSRTSDLAGSVRLTKVERSRLAAEAASIFRKGMIS